MTAISAAMAGVIVSLAVFFAEHSISQSRCSNGITSQWQ
jgi:hypothetical protein